jgi:hypothetical protein
MFLSQMPGREKQHLSGIPTYEDLERFGQKLSRCCLDQWYGSLLERG